VGVGDGVARYIRGSKCPSGRPAACTLFIGHDKIEKVPGTQGFSERTFPFHNAESLPSPDLHGIQRAEIPELFSAQMLFN
jgi:hypothetical protein